MMAFVSWKLKVFQVCDNNSRPTQKQHLEEVSLPMTFQRNWTEVTLTTTTQEPRENH